MYFVSINAGAQVAIILLTGGAPRTKETLPDFHEWCRVTRHPRVFHGLTGCQRDPRVLGRQSLTMSKYKENANLELKIKIHYWRFSKYDL